MKLAATAAIVAVFAVLAGCGGSSNSSTGNSSTATVKPAEFAAALKLAQRENRLWEKRYEALADAKRIETTGSKGAARNLQLVAEQDREEAEALIDQLAGYGHAVQIQVSQAIEAERER